MLVGGTGQFLPHEDGQSDKVFYVVAAWALAFGNLSSRRDQRFLTNPEVVLRSGDVDKSREGLATDAGPFARLAGEELDVVRLVTAEGAFALLEVIECQLAGHFERAAPRDALRDESKREERVTF